jgi:hypothetical protein
MNHGVLCWTSSCESWCVMLRQTLWIMVWYDEPVAVNHGMWCCAKGCESWCVIHSHWLIIPHPDSQRLAQHYSPWHTITVVANHCVLCWASGCESWCVMLSQWLWIIGCYYEPVVVNRGVIYWASGCESWWVMLSQWLHNPPSFTTTSSAMHTMTHNHWLSIPHHHS